MADNYLLFSETLELYSEEELQWWKDATRNVNSGEGVYWKGFHDYPHDKPWFIRHPEVEFDDGSIVFYSEDYADIEPLCWLVWRFFQWRAQCRKKANLHLRWMLTWAATCSKSRPGEFSGGVAVVTEKGYQLACASEFAELLESRIAESAEGAASSDSES